jgi:hypothetical protein
MLNANLNVPDGDAHNYIMSYEKQMTSYDAHNLELFSAQGAFRSGRDHRHGGDVNG